MRSVHDVVVVGNVGIDTNVYSGNGLFDFGEGTHFTENIDYVGQAGGFTSRGFARLGWKTAFIGYVGDDAGGGMIRAAFQEDGVDMAGLFIDPAGSSRSINFMDGQGERRNFYDPKSHFRLMPDLARCRQVMSGTRLVHVHLPNWARVLLPLAQELGVTIACDLQDMRQLDDAYRQDFINYADILFFSAAYHADPTPVVETLLAQRPERVVVVGMGTAGCMVGAGTTVLRCPPVHLPLPVVDTNGAGDGLAVGFLSSYVLEGYPLEEAIRRAQIVARYTCSLRATSDQLISRDQLEAYLVEVARPQPKERGGAAQTEQPHSN